MFLEPVYFFLLVAAAAAYYFAPRNQRTSMLVIASLLFYAYFGGWFLLILLAEILLTYLCATAARNDGLYYLGIAVPLSILGFYKYLFDALGPATRFTSITESVIIPLGLSYLTFELVHYLVDARKGLLTSHTFLDFLAFVLFFPSFAAGPIKRFSNFFFQPRQARFVPGTMLDGSLRIALGLFKKVVIADSLVGTSAILTNYLNPSPEMLWLGIFAFSLRIYFDFSAYSDIAIGSARMFGIMVPENFANPYLKKNVREFWRSWHMSLTRWVTDYVFIPLGGSRASSLLTVRNILIVFAIIGLWHGGTLSFLLWGLYNGALVSLHVLWSRSLGARLEKHAWYRSLPMHAAGIASTFVLISFGWIFFTTASSLLPLVLSRALLLG